MGELPSTQEVVRLYYEEGLTQFDIADKFNVTQSAVSNCMRRAGEGPGYEANRVPWASYYTTPRGYEHWSSRDTEGGYEYVKVHRLLAVAEYGFDAVKDIHVHHQNKISWDNRPENIELLSPSEHMGEHSREEVKNRSRNEDGTFAKEKI